ncbi:MAG: S8 family peptidase [Bacteroidetes bacterium]|nr:S8 family peptidase [Bacteroidota bacterium]MBU1719016.1 S8 family peptidase [Bacteroidota bacterium]
MRNLYLSILFSAFCYGVFAQQTTEKPYRNAWCNLESMTVGVDYQPGTVIFKVKEEFRDKCSRSAIQDPILSELFSEIHAISVQKIFPRHQPPVEKVNQLGVKLVDLSLIYRVKFDDEIEVQNVVNRLYFSGMMEYAEPEYICYLLYSPNDPMRFYQYSLKIMNVYSAWEVCKGDTNVVIAISDTGVDIDHPDISPNIAYNYYDPIDGIDNDNDGYIDNYMGWDIAENDNNPDCTVNYHGNHVAGISAAKTNNATGIAGVGFKCRILPIKVGGDDNSLRNTYESIIYAADHNADVINCSWGSMGGHGQFGQDVVTYASVNRTSLVVAACGNAGSQVYWYPASYDNVLSVAASDSSDHKWVNSTYNDKVDVTAPGADVYSCWTNGGYTYGNGTSMASPNAAGAAAILKSYPYYSSFSGLQIGEQLKVHTDVIDTMAANLAYSGKLGTGRVNLLRALTDFDIPALKMADYTVTDNDDNIINSGETIDIVGTYINYLAPSSPALKVTLHPTAAADSALVYLYSNVKILGTMNTLESKSHPGSPFKVQIFPTYLHNQTINFTVLFEDTTTHYTSTQNFSINYNIDYINVEINKVGTTVTSNSRIGYTDNTARYGLGFRYEKRYPFLAIAGLMLGNSATRVSDCVYGNSFYQYEGNFLAGDVARLVYPPVFSDFDVQARFSDSAAGVNMLNVSVLQNTYAWADVENGKYVIFEYYIKNNGSSDIESLYAGLYADWDIEFDANGLGIDRAMFDPDYRMGYVYSDAGRYFAGTQLLSAGPISHYAIDNDGTYGSVNVADGFSGAEKLATLKNSRSSAGFMGVSDGNDVSNVVSTGPLTIHSGDSVKVTFALLAGTDLNDLRFSAEKALAKYNPTGVQKVATEENISIRPNPAATYFEIIAGVPFSEDVQIELSDISGKSILVRKISSPCDNIQVDISSIPEGTYAVCVKSGKRLMSRKLVISRH